jgi:hypothetical protein
MSQKGRDATHLRLLPAPVAVTSSRNAGRRTPKAQRSFVIESATNLLAVVNMMSMSARKFFELLETRPRAVVDLRVVPRFDMPGLRRRAVLNRFKAEGCDYFDFTGQFSISSSVDARLNPDLVGEELNTRFKKGGPLVILVDGHVEAQEYAIALSRRIRPGRRKSWDLFVYE